jgi:anaerobic magnesium-protoporphyrin IX monomethyl ester cyclase
MCDVILINPPSDCVDDDHLEPQLGLLYIASVLRENGISVGIYEMTGCRNETEIEDKIKNIPEALIYGFTTYCTNYRFVKRCVDFIRSNRGQVFIILGGPNPTALPRLTLNDSQCDGVVTGEGEDAFLYAAKAVLKKQSVPKILHGTGRTDINTYPFPAWDLIDLNSYTRAMDGERVVSILSSRGCEHRCAHCNSIIMGGGNPVRYRDPKNVAREMVDLKANGFTKFRFNDDNFSGNPHLKALLSEIARLQVEYRIFARIEDLSVDTCERLQASGCRHISVGLESLDPDNLEILNKQRQRGVETINLGNVKKSGMIARVYFMIGLPFDTDDRVMEYFGKSSRLPFDEYSLYPLIPYPGTLFWKEPERLGYEILDTDFTHYIQIGKGGRTCFAMKHKNFTPEHIEEWFTRVTQIMVAAGKKHVSESQVAK